MPVPALKTGQLKQYNHLHFVGIGGSGMFPIVEILLAMGHRITGSDQATGDNTEREEALGAIVFLGHNADHLGNCDAVVYSAAINQNNPELIAASSRNIPIIERSELLGYLTREYSNCV